MYRIFAALNFRALGDFAAFALLVSSIREMFDESELYVYYRDDRPYKNFIVSCVPNITGTIRATSPKITFPLDYFDYASGGPQIEDEMFKRSDMRRPDLVLVAPMYREAMLNSIPLTRLWPPLEKIEGLRGTAWVKAVG